MDTCNIQIFVGSPEDDTKVTVNTGQTVSQVLNENEVSLTGMVQHNGRTLTAKQLGTTLALLGVVENDSIHIVRKMDGAQG